MSVECRGKEKAGYEGRCLGLWLEYLDGSCCLKSLNCTVAGWGGGGRWMGAEQLWKGAIGLRF